MSKKTAGGLNRALKALRVFNRLSQDDLAHCLDIPASYVSEIETGKRAATLKLVDKYSEYFDLSASEIVYLGETYESQKVRTNVLGSKLLDLLDWVMDGDSKGCRVKTIAQSNQRGIKITTALDA